MRSKNSFRLLIHRSCSEKNRLFSASLLDLTTSTSLSPMGGLKCEIAFLNRFGLTQIQLNYNFARIYNYSRIVFSFSLIISYKLHSKRTSRFTSTNPVFRSSSFHLSNLTQNRKHCNTLLRRTSSSINLERGIFIHSIIQIGLWF